MVKELDKPFASAASGHK